MSDSKPARKEMTPTASLFPKGEPEVYGEYRGEVLGMPFRRFGVQVYTVRRFGAVGYRFTGVLYEVELPRPFPFLHLAPRGWPTYPRERWPFLLAFLMLSGVLLALLARRLAGLPVLKPGTSPLLLLVFPALYLHLFAAWRVATGSLYRLMASRIIAPLSFTIFTPRKPLKRPSFSGEARLFRNTLPSSLWPSPPGS